MRPRDVLREFAGLTALVMVVAPLASLVLAAVSDRGPTGQFRFTAVPAALVLFDPLIERSIRHSVAVAGCVSGLSLLLGGLLARLMTAHRFWGRPLLIAACALPAACPPLIGAFGLALSATEGRPILPIRLPGVDARWLALAWVELSFATPWVAWQIASALRAIRPPWIDAARVAGASRSRVWTQLVWPVVRPTAARATAAVFLLVLMEPGAPLVLGLRQTLPIQVVESLRLGDSAAIGRAAVLAVLGLSIGAGVRRLLLWWGGPSDLPSPDPASPSRSIPATSPFEAGLSAIQLALLAAMGIVPIASLVLGASDLCGNGRGFATGLGNALVGGLSDDSLAGALTLGLRVLPVAAVLGWGLFGTTTGSRARVLGRAISPLGLGVGVFCLPILLAAVSGALGLHVVRLPTGLERGLPVWPSVGYALAVLHAPWAGISLRDSVAAAPPALLDAARSLGAGRLRVLWSIARPLAGPPLAMGAGVVVMLASCSLTPALILSPGPAATPLGLALADHLESSAELPSAASVAVLILLSGLATLPALASWQARGDAGPPRV